MAPTAAPVARPWATRAASSTDTPDAVANRTITPAWSTSAASRTGRRPTWSDNEPKTSRDASTATAYTPKITVIVTAENPHCA